MIISKAHIRGETENINCDPYIPAASGTQSAVDKKLEGQGILALRVQSCSVWMAAAFIGCLVFSGWIGWHRAETETLHPLDTINPNTAPKESLVRLPGIGPARAMTIVDYRKAHSNKGPAFRTPADLDAIAGLGPKTIEKMMPWILFDGPGQ
jgi:DNA uptake protein ComE-like DNA-binding protein